LIYGAWLARSRYRSQTTPAACSSRAAAKISVATDILGATGRGIIQAIIAGQEHPDWLADKAKGRLRGKRPELRLVLRGRLREHHRLMLRELMEEMEFVERNIQRIEHCSPVRSGEDRAALYDSGRRSGHGVDPVSGTGFGYERIWGPKNVSSWAGLCPGNRESARRRLSNRTRKGNRWLRRAMCQSAWAATRKKNCFLAAFFYRKAGKHGLRKAIVALAHRILVIAFCILRDGTEYREVGGDYFDRIHPERTRNRLVRRLQRLGQDVLLQPRADAPSALVGNLDSISKRGRPCKCSQRGIPCKHGR